MIKLLRIFLKKYTPNLYNQSLPMRNFIYKNFFTQKNAINVLKEFAEFAPNVTGESSQKIENTVFNIKNYTKYAVKLAGIDRSINELSSLGNSSNRKLGNIFQKYGSDKKTHEYDYLYQKIIDSDADVKFIVEIGIGSNNPEVMSNMSQYGSPGASLKSFRDYIENSHVIGLEYDKSVLFSDDRIETFFYDQNSDSSVSEMATKLENQVDLLIDDGLHSIIANINSIKLAESVLKKGGYLVIEDIGSDSLNSFMVIFELVKSKFAIDIYTNKSCYVASLQKLY
jgi:hypothetical protein